MEIITDLTMLQEAVEPLKFITDTAYDTTEGQEIIDKLKKTLEENPNIEAISAPQIGIKKRIFCIKFDTVIKTFINPILNKKVGCEIGIEKCASLPGKEILTARPTEVFVKYYNDEFKYEDNKLTGYAARLFDQQYQFLDGVTPDLIGLISDVAEDGSFYDLSEEDKVKVIDIYIQWSQLKAKEAKESIPEESKTLYNQLKFTEDVINGRTQVIDATPKNREQRRAATKEQKRQERINREIQELIRQEELEKKKAEEKANKIKTYKN